MANFQSYDQDFTSPHYSASVTSPQGVHAHVPTTTWLPRDFEHEAEENSKLVIPAGSIQDILRATWGAGRSEVDVTAQVSSRLKEGGVDILATTESLGCEDPAPGQKKKLIVRYAEMFYVNPEKRLDGIDLTTPEGKLLQAEVHNDRMTHEIQMLQESLARAERRENHYREVESRLKREIQEKAKLEQAVYDNEGALVATRLRELERDAARLRRLLKNEQDSVLTEQKLRQQSEDQLQTIKQVKGGTGATLQGQITDLREENDRLVRQVTDINRLNLQLQLSVKDQAANEQMKADLFAHDNTDHTGAMTVTSHVRVRKSTLCPQCKSNVEMWERQAISRAHRTDRAVQYPPPPSQNQNAGYPSSTSPPRLSYGRGLPPTRI